jgi:hypothetical protein
MRKIREMIANKFPECSEFLLSTLEIDYVGEIDADIDMSMTALYNKKKLRRPVCQYRALAQITRSLQQDVEIAIEHAPRHSAMYRTIHDSLTCYPVQAGSGELGRLLPNFNLKDSDLEIFRRFVFPIITLSKNKMAQIAKKNAFLDILSESFSCWYPVKETGKPCGKCLMCKERIL